MTSDTGVPVKAWIRGVPIEPEAERQLRRVASLPSIHQWVAAMPDVHFGKGATVGSVIATKGALIPAAVGVDMRRWFINLPDADLAYLPTGTDHFDDYVEAVHWAQAFAMCNRRLMMAHVIDAMRTCGELPDFDASLQAVNCHHNYVAVEYHYGHNVWVTRKGAVRARQDDMGIIPDSMGARSYMVRGLGNPESFHSCSHGAGRTMSRNQARRQFMVADHEVATAGIECRKDAEVLDETPACYKDIDAVLAAQRDFVEIAHTLHQVVCVKG